MVAYIGDEKVRWVRPDVTLCVWRYLAACIFMRWCGVVCDSDGIWGGCESNMGATCATDTPAPLRSVYTARAVYHIIPRRENALAVSLLWSSLKVMGRDERNINLALCITARERESGAPHQRQSKLCSSHETAQQYLRVLSTPITLACTHAHAVLAKTPYTERAHTF
jgi:hypothetical protein